MSAETISAEPRLQSACPVCLHTERHLVASWAQWDESLERRDDGAMRRAASEACGVDRDAPDLMECGACGSVGMSLIPTDRQLQLFYSNYHMTDGFVRKAGKKIARAQKRLLLLSLLAPQAKGRKRRFLEIGASIGTAAEAARRFGFQAHAVEPDPDAVDRGRELFPEVSFIRGMIEDVDPSEPFELLYGAEVIEHVPDPGAFLDRCHERLSPNGILYLTTPDCGHRKRPERLLDWHSVKPPEHINLFTKTGMAALLKAHGFERHWLPPHTKPGMRVIAWRT